MASPSLLDQCAVDSTLSPRLFLTVQWEGHVVYRRATGRRPRPQRRASFSGARRRHHDDQEGRTTPRRDAHREIAHRETPSTQRTLSHQGTKGGARRDLGDDKWTTATNHHSGGGQYLAVEEGKIWGTHQPRRAAVVRRTVARTIQKEAPRVLSEAPQHHRGANIGTSLTQGKEPHAQKDTSTA